MGGPNDDEIRPVEREPGPSVIRRLEELAGDQPKIHLRDLPEEASREVEPSEGNQGRYRIVGEIARGGIGVILKGRDEDIGRDVAMKVLREEHDSDPEIVRRFVEEAQVGGQLQHPGVVPVYDIGLNEARRPFFAMKLVKGRTLEAVLAEGSAQRGLLRVFLQVCETIAYAHSRYVIHRDIKPANIVLGAYGEVQVVDWGFAKVLDGAAPAAAEAANTTMVSTVRTSDSDSDSIAGAVMGTPAYMPPEQALGQIDDLDARTDVFALGALLCEILTGEPPYVAADRDALLDLAARGDLDAAFDRLDRCDADSDAVALAKACLAPLKSERPRDAGEVAARVAEIRASAAARADAVRIEAAAAVTRAREQAKQRRLVLILGIAALLLLAVCGGAYAWLERDARRRMQALANRLGPVVERTERLRGERRWSDARAAAVTALQVATDHQSTEWIGTAAALVARIDAEEREDVETRARDRRESALIDALRIAEDRQLAVPDTDRTVAAFRAAFREFGEHALEGRPIALEVAATLDSLAFLVRASEPEEAARLWDRAARVDDDPWRTDARRELAAGGSPPLPEEIEHPRTLELAARVLLERGRVGAAHARLEKVPVRFQHDFRLLALCGNVAYESGHVAEALGAYECAHALRPGSIAARAGLAKAGATQRVELIRHAVAAWPENRKLRLDLAFELVREREHEQAREIAMACAEEAPDDPRARIAVGYSQRDPEDRRRAETEWEEAGVQFLPLLAAENERLQRFTFAARHWTRLWIQDREQAEYALRAIESFLRSREWKRAAELLDGLAEQSATPRLALLRAIYDARHGDVEAARATLDAHPRRDEEPVEVTRARAYAEQLLEATR